MPNNASCLLQTRNTTHRETGPFPLGQVKQTFEAAVMRKLYPRTQMDIQVRTRLCPLVTLYSPTHTHIRTHHSHRDAHHASPPALQHALPHTTAQQLYVLQTDGSLLPALINATSLALADAGIAMQELVAACSVALLDDQPVLVRRCDVMVLLAFVPSVPATDARMRAVPFPSS